MKVKDCKIGQAVRKVKGWPFDGVAYVTHLTDSWVGVTFEGDKAFPINPDEWELVEYESDEKQFKPGDEVYWEGPDGEKHFRTVKDVQGEEIHFTNGRWTPRGRVFPVRPEPAQQNDWSYTEADRLYAAAEAAIKQYNEYINLKPSTHYGSISLVGTRVEPGVEKYNGDD